MRIMRRSGVIVLVLAIAGVVGGQTGAHATTAPPSSAARQTIHDPKGDNGGNPNADITAATINPGSRFYSMTVAAPLAPTSAHWLGETAAFWHFDTDFDGHSDIDIQFSHTGARMLATNVSGPGAVLCTGQTVFDGRYIAHFPSTCPKIPARFQWQVSLAFDTLTGGLNSIAFDFAPSPNGTWATGHLSYTLRGADDRGHGFCGAPSFAPTAGSAVGIAVSAGGAGLWSLDASGHVHTSGTAAHLGDASLASGERAIGIAAEAGGYWIFTSRGRVFSFGIFGLLGDLRAKHLAAPVVAAAAAPGFGGYYMLTADGAVFAFGDAKLRGSMQGRKVNAAYVAITPTPDNTGYWLTGADGGVFAFNAPFRGSMGGHHINAPVNGMAAYGNGYLMVASDGGVFDFSNAAFCGSLAGNKATHPVRAMATFSN